MKHTCGPWTDDGHDGKDTQIVNSKWGEVARVVYNGDCAQRTANARLIAAAPEMLDALRCAMDMINTARRYFPKSIQNPSRFQLENTCATIGKAISKAEGKAP